MAQLNPKPFNRLQKIIRAIHKGKPNLLTNVDLNRHFDILRDSSDYLWKLMGTDFNAVFTNASIYNPLNSNSLVVDVTWQAFTVVIRAVQLSVPAGGFSFETAEQNYPALRIYLIAKKRVATFSTDPDISGVTAPTLPTALASSEHEVFYAERVDWSVYPNTPVLAPDEEIVCRLATVIPIQSADSYTPKLFKLSHSAYTDRLKQLLGDKFGDCNLAELNHYILEYFFNYATEPVGTWKGYHGSTTGNFDATGLGINKFAGWAFPNGANDTPDWRGRGPLMFDNRTINPGNGIWDPEINPQLNSTKGNLIGERKHTLTIAEMPKHGHQVKDGNSGSSTNPLTGGNAGDTGFSGMDFGSGWIGSDTADSYWLKATGGGQGHNNIQPSFVTGIILRVS